ncbi:MAG: succinylglutamate desuccinylase/aspartoacylase family protein [Planctomycetes bacterium]|nr:succinylglutamate desuccinylase/aspartoacylase family protein [Planctomycetota bacterium]
MSASDPRRAALAERIVFEAEGRARGPVVFVCAALHGNETDGLLAAQAVAAAIDPRQLRGKLVVFVGNRGALASGQRYQERDLNRAFSEERFQAWSSGALGASAEDGEQRAILELLAERAPRDGSRAVLLDLHSTSGGGPPFVVFGDTRANRRIGLALGIPAILGLEEAIDGTLLEFLARRGHVAVCVEGGKIGEPQTGALLEAALWVALVAAGALPASAVPDLPAKRAKLRSSAGALPRVLEIRHRHALHPEQSFRMRPGWKGFDRLARGTVLADDHAGEVRSPEDGFLLMPLYQARGDDGFFLAREVRRIWLHVATAFRALRLDRVVPLLPGVARDAEEPETLLVDPRIARWWTVEIFHLLGYRRQRARGALLAFSRRRPGHLPALPIR